MPFPPPIFAVPQTDFSVARRLLSVDVGYQAATLDGKGEVKVPESPSVGWQFILPTDHRKEFIFFTFAISQRQVIIHPCSLFSCVQAQGVSWAATFRWVLTVYCSVPLANVVIPTSDGIYRIPWAGDSGQRGAQPCGTR